MTEEVFTIRQLARRSGVNAKTLRYWEAQRLLPKPRRTHTNYRLYTPADLERVRFIRKAKRLGFTLAEIRRIFELGRDRGAPCEAVVSWAGAKIAVLSRQIDALAAIRARLIRYHRKWQRAGGCPPLRSDEICCLIEEVPLLEGDAPAKEETDGTEKEPHTLPGLRRLPRRRAV